MTYLKKEDETQITFIKKGRTKENFDKTNLPGVIAIQKIPQVNMKTAKLKGYIYSVVSSKKNSRRKRFKKKSDALNYAKSLMK